MTRNAWLVLVGVLLLALPGSAAATPEEDVAAATAAGRPVFLIVTEPKAAGTDLARRVAAEAQKIVAETAIVEMDRTDRANEALVKRYRLESVPVPLILVVGPNGVAAGGAKPAQVTPGRLAAMVPTPAKAAMLKAIEEKKAVFLVFSRETMTDKAAATNACHTAVATLKGAAAVVPVDLDAEREARFVQEKKVDVRTKVPIILVHNAKGLVTASLTGVPKSDDLAAAATKTAECCPGGNCK